MRVRERERERGRERYNKKTFQPSPKSLYHGAVARNASVRSSFSSKGERGEERRGERVNMTRNTVKRVIESLFSVSVSWQDVVFISSKAYSSLRRVDENFEGDEGRRGISASRRVFSRLYFKTLYV